MPINLKNSPTKYIQIIWYQILVLFFLTLPAPLLAQSGEPEVLVAPRTATPVEPETITLTKTVDVYKFEDLSFAVDTYRVTQGESLASILKAQGLLPGADETREAQMLRLVRQLNPQLAGDLGQIAPGQDLNLPATGTLEVAPSGSPTVPNLTISEVTTQVTSEVPKQTPNPEETTVQTTVSTDPIPEPTQASVTADYPGNDGPIAQSEDGTVYRTVTIRKGDNLEKLLRREGMDPDLIYRHLLKLTVRLNPDLRDPNIIIAGAELRIPVQGNYLEDINTRPAPILASNTSSQTITRPEKTKKTRQKDQPTPKESQKPALAPVTSTKNPKRLQSALLPTADNLNAKTVLGIIFTRLGEKVSSQGRLFLPLDEPPHFDIDMTNIPVIDLQTNRKLILDLSHNLTPDLVKRFREKYPEYMVFQPTKNESMEKALERLWPLCGYFKVYNRTQPFEGGRDIRLKISADWLVWPTSEAWNRGQPTVINVAPAPDNATPGPWIKFLTEHGIKVIDLYKDGALAASVKAPTTDSNFTIININEDDPGAFAADLLKSFGFSPRVGLNINPEDGRVTTGGNIEPGFESLVYWEYNQKPMVMEYGNLQPEHLNTLKSSQVTVVSSGRNPESILKTLLNTFNIKSGQDIILNGNSPGGPTVSLTIRGQSFVFNGTSYLYTSVTVPENLAYLDPNQNVVVLKHKPTPTPAPTQTLIAPQPQAESSENSNKANSDNPGSQEVKVEDL